MQLQSSSLPQEVAVMAEEHESQDNQENIQEPRYWSREGWVAKVIKNEDDDGWAVEMYLKGEVEPALVTPWVMGRDKKNPKPLDHGAFRTLVKTASEVLERHRRQREASLHKKLYIYSQSVCYTIALDVVPDEYEPYATLSARDESGSEVASKRVAPNYKFSAAAMQRWADGGFRD